MAPKKSSESSSDQQPQPLTEKELQFIKAVFDNMTQKPDADWDAVATTLSLKDAKCAKERWRQMSVRHGWREGGGASPRKGGTSGAGRDSKVTKKPRTPRKKAKKEEDVEFKSEVDEEV